MQSKSLLLRISAFVPCAALALFVSACEGSDRGYRSPTAPPVPTTPPAPFPSPSHVFWGEVTNLSPAGSGSCEYFLEKMAHGWYWGLALTGDSLRLYPGWTPEDSLVYTGTLNGRSFAASAQILDFSTYPCQLREASISGTFAEDFSSFEAHETVIWGPPENELRVDLRWLAQRR